MANRLRVCHRQAARNRERNRVLWLGNSRRHGTMRPRMARAILRQERCLSALRLIFYPDTMFDDLRMEPPTGVSK